MHLFKYDHSKKDFLPISENLFASTTEPATFSSSRTYYREKLCQSRILREKSEVKENTATGLDHIVS
jgi:hypothetical protein